MTLRRLLIIVPVLFAAVLAAAYASLPLWAPAAVQRVLPPAVTLNRLVLQRPGWRAWTIDRLDLTYGADTARVHADVSGLDLQYRWSELRRGRLDSVNAASLHLAIRQTAAGASASKRQPLQFPTPAAVLAQLPAARIDLPQIALEIPAPDRIQQWSGNAHFIAGTLTLELAGQTVPQLDFSLRADRDNALDLSLRRKNQPVAVLHSRIETAHLAQGNLELELAPLLALARDWNAVPKTLENAALHGNIALDWRGPLPTGLDSSSLRSLTLKGSLAADISADSDGSAGQLAARADYAFADGAVDLTVARLSASGALALPAAARTLLPKRSTLPFTASLKADSRVHVTTLPLHVAVQGPAALSMGDPGAAATRLALTLRDTELTSDANGPRLRTHIDLDAGLAQWRQAPYRLRQLRAQFGGELDASPQQGTLQLEPGAQWRTQAVHGPDLAVAPLHAVIDQPTTLRWNARTLALASAHLHLDGSSVERAAQRLRFAGATAAVSDLRVDLDAPRAASAQATLALNGISAPIGPYRTKPLHATADVQFQNAELRGHWRLSTPVKDLALHGAVHHDLKTGAGGLTAALPAFAFRENGSYLPALLEDWPYPFGLSGGRLGIDARVSWGRALRAKVAIAAHDLAGFYDMNVFKGLDAEPVLTYADGTLGVAPTHLALAEFNAGFAVTNLQCDISAQLPDAVTIDDLSAELLGGTLTQPALHYRRDNAETRSTWHFKGLHLGELVALEKNMEGEGILDGELPVVLSPAGIAVSGGELHARAPGGLIRYNGDLPEASIAQVPALRLALASLRNFHFRTLTARADYAPSGDLDLGVGMLGRNPDVAEPRPIQFNLTINENIPQLLRSLQLDSDISDKIEERVQEFYRHHQQEMR